MKLINIIPYIVISIWCILVISISFLLPLSKLSIHSFLLQPNLNVNIKVFAISNNIELLLLVLIFSWFIINAELITNLIIIEIGLLFFIMLIQTLWFFPELTTKSAGLINTDANISKPNFHLNYLIFELIKLVTLIGMFMQLMKQFIKSKRYNPNKVLQNF